MSFTDIATVAETPEFAKRVMVAATILALPYSKEMVLHVAVQCRDSITGDDDGTVDGSSITDGEIIAALEATMSGAAPEPTPEPEPEPEPEPAETDEN